MDQKPKAEISVNDTMNNSQMVDLTLDNSVLDLTEMSEAMVEGSTVLDDLPTEASFSKHLEDRPSTGKYFD